VLIPLADHVDPPGASVKLDALPGEPNQLVDAQPNVQQQHDDRFEHRPTFLGLANEPPTLDVGKAFRRERLSVAVGQVLSWVACDTLGLGRPAVEPARCGQRDVDRGRPLTRAELGLVLPQVAGGRLEELGVVVLLEPGGEALQVGDVLTGGALATFVSSARNARKAGNGLSDEKWGLVSARSSAPEKGGGPTNVPDSSLKASFPTDLFWQLGRHLRCLHIRRPEERTFDLTDCLGLQRAVFETGQRTRHRLGPGCRECSFDLAGLLSARVSHDAVPVREGSPLVVENEY
jgi:hypothetical protein